MRFRYLADPLFLLCFVLYFVNRFLFKRLVGDGFFHDHFNDLICLPFWVPILVLLKSKLGLRADHAPPHPDEILIPLIVWSAVFELYLPHVRHFQGLATADPEDILWYVVGGLLASVIWPITYRARNQRALAGGRIAPR